jgi:hypothetical protein
MSVGRESLRCLVASVGVGRHSQLVGAVLRKRRRVLVGASASAAILGWALASCTSLSDLSNASGTDASVHDASTDTTSSVDANPTVDATVPIDGNASNDSATPSDSSTPSDAATDTNMMPPADASTGCVSGQIGDSNNCGSCGHSCFGGSCLANVCQPTTFVSGQGFIQSTSYSSGYVYWSSPSLLNRRSTSGGSLQTLLTHAAGVAIVADPSYLFWTDTNGIYKVPFDGGALTILTSAMSQSAGAHDIAMDDASVYTSSEETSFIERIAKDGTSIVQQNLHDGQNALDPIKIAVDSTNVYVVGDYKTGAYSMPNTMQGAGTEIDSVHTPDSDSPIIVDHNDGVYWRSSGTLYRRALDTGAFTPIATSEAIVDFAIDQNAIVWTDDPTPDGGTDGGFETTGTLLRAATNGSNETTIASSLSHPRLVLVTEDSYFFATSETGGTYAIMRLAK